MLIPPRILPYIRIDATKWFVVEKVQELIIILSLHEIIKLYLYNIGQLRSQEP